MCWLVEHCLRNVSAALPKAYRMSIKSSDFTETTSMEDKGETREFQDKKKKVRAGEHGREVWTPTSALSSESSEG